MQLVMDMFTPTKNLSKQIMKMMIIGQILFVSVIWLTAPTVFMPKPNEVTASFSEMWTHWDLGQNVIASMQLNAEAVLIAALISTSFAYLGTIPFFTPLVTLIGKLRFLSMAGLTFAFTMMTSSGHELKLSLLVFGITVFFVTGMVDVVLTIPKEQYDLARTLGMNEWRTLWEVVILGQADKAFDVLRQNAAMGFMLLTEVECMARSGGGIGTLLATQQRYLNFSAIMAIQIMVFVLGMGQDYLISYVKKLCCPYANLTLEKRI